MLVALIAGKSFSQEKLDDYIKQGLENNEIIKQRSFNINKAVFALKEAKSLFYPSVSFSTSYTVAGGGRTIDLPIGDLLNPVYSSLNQLTASNAFPTVENQSVLLNPNNFYDAKIHTTMPLINYEIIYNKRIKAYQSDMAKTELEVYKRELVKDIKIAYYQYIQAEEARKIYETALRLTEENYRLNKSLFTNQKINRTALLRSENEVLNIKAKLEEAVKNKINAQSYFNFLINKDFAAPIEVEQDFTTIPLGFENDKNTAREELTKLNIAAEISSSAAKLVTADWMPKLSAFIDVGYQDFEFVFDKQSRYYFGGISLEWNIFSSNKTKYRAKQVEEDSKIINSQILNAQQQLKLQFEVARNTLLAKLEIYKSEKSQVAAAQKYNDDIVKLYKEGLAIYLELLDAQNQYINSLLKTNIAFYETWIAFAEVERANATFNLN